MCDSVRVYAFLAYKLFVFSTNQFYIIGVDCGPLGMPVECVFEQVFNI